MNVHRTTIWKGLSLALTVLAGTVGLRESP